MTGNNSLKMIMIIKQYMVTKKNKFTGFGDYSHELIKENERRINELVELTEQEYPTMDNYLIWICAVDYMIEELNIKVDNSSGKQLNDDSMKKRNKTVYNSVELKEE
jgi:hypothetical protein